MELFLLLGLFRVAINQSGLEVLLNMIALHNVGSLLTEGDEFFLVTPHQVLSKGHLIFDLLLSEIRNEFSQLALHYCRVESSTRVRSE